MTWLIMDDLIDYKSEFYPTHILGFNNKVIPVYMGASSIIDDKAIGIYVSDEDYEKIDHSKEYVFIHDPDLLDRMSLGIMTPDSTLSRVIFSMLAESPLEVIEDIQSVNRPHRHIW